MGIQIFLFIYKIWQPDHRTEERSSRKSLESPEDSKLTSTRELRPTLTELLEVLIAPQEEDLRVDNQKRCSLETKLITRLDTSFQTVSRTSLSPTKWTLKCSS